MKKILAGAVAVGALAIVSPAGAQEALNQFGAQGQLAIDAQGGAELYADPYPAGSGALTTVGLTPFIGWSFRTEAAPNINNGPHDDVKTHSFYLNPGADYFVIDHLSIGGEVLIASTGSSVTHHAPNTADRTDDGQDGFHFGLMPRVGYDIPIGNMFSLWPRASIGFQHSSYSGAGQPDASGTIWLFAIDVPFMFHFAEHFFAGVGPGVTVTLSSSVSVGGVSQDGGSYTDIRLLSAIIGGYI